MFGDLWIPRLLFVRDGEKKGKGRKNVREYSISNKFCCAVYIEVPHFSYLFFFPHVLILSVGESSTRWMLYWYLVGGTVIVLW